MLCSTTKDGGQLLVVLNSMLAVLTLVSLFASFVHERYYSKTRKTNNVGISSTLIHMVNLFYLSGCTPLISHVWVFVILIHLPAQRCLFRYE